MAKPRFDVYGRYQVQIERHGDRWVVFLLGEGKRREHPSLFIPPDVEEDDLAAHLDDLLHEEGGGARTIRRIA